MRILLGYTRCPHSRAAFEAAGCDVWTCDLLDEDHPKHLTCDVWEVLGEDWAFALLHPMCTYMTVSAAWAYKDPDFDRYPGVGYHQRPKPETLVGKPRREAQERELENFRRLLALPYPKAIENPSPSFINTRIRPPDQTIQPYDFGDDASKSTGLWLDGVPPLKQTRRHPGRRVEWPRGSGKLVERWSNQLDSGQNALPPSESRWLKRSHTYRGIAAAMGAQWGPLFAKQDA